MAKSKRDWLKQTVVGAMWVLVGGLGNAALTNDPEISTIVKEIEVVQEVIVAYRFSTRQEFEARKTELITMAKAADKRNEAPVPMTIPDIQDLWLLIAFDSVGRDPIVMTDISGDVGGILDAALEQERLKGAAD